MSTLLFLVMKTKKKYPTHLFLMREKGKSHDVLI